MLTVVCTESITIPNSFNIFLWVYEIPHPEQSSTPKVVHGWMVGCPKHKSHRDQKRFGQTFGRLSKCASEENNAAMGYGLLHSISFTSYEDIVTIFFLLNFEECDAVIQNARKLQVPYEPAMHALHEYACSTAKTLTQQVALSRAGGEDP